MLDVVYVYVPFKAKKETDRETTQCLKITEKVSFFIKSEASYVYILSGQ